jgi:hypothetical protein
MFSNTAHSYLRIWPKLGLIEWLGRCRVMHQNCIDPESMPEDLRRDLGLLDGRGRRGGIPQEGAFRAARLIYTQRSL